MSRRAIVGVDLGGTNVRVGRVSDRTLEAHHGQRISGLAAEHQVLEEIYQAVGRVLDENVIGIGCGVPSVVDAERGIVYAVENIPSWREVHLKDHLERRFGLPVAINNDANAFVLGELHCGQARGFRNVVGLTLGTGLGAGVVVDGRLYTGSHGGVGEIGSIPHKDHTVEFYSAGQFFPHAAGESGEAVYERARAGDEEAERIFEAYGAELGHAVMVALYAYDPELVVLGGSIAQAYDLFAGGLHRKLEEYDYQHALEQTAITPSRMEHVAILGAAELFVAEQAAATPKRDAVSSTGEPPS